VPVSPDLVGSVVAAAATILDIRGRSRTDRRISHVSAGGWERVLG
jgi:hypothetical protein